MAKASAVTVFELDQEAIKAREEAVAKETDEEILERIKNKFDTLEQMTYAVRRGDVRSMIVSGPPGVGKSFGVEKVLNKTGVCDALAHGHFKHEIVRGSMSGIGLYAKLHEFKEKGNVLVFDDSDDIFFNDTCLLLLKAALDSGEQRFINWNKDSRLLRTEGIEDRFEFQGTVIFITNIKFAHVRSKKLKAHLQALESRSHYIDLDMDTEREKILRIKQVITDYGMLDRYGFDDAEKAEMIAFVENNIRGLREVSLRTVLKASDLRKAFPNAWKMMAGTTLMRPKFKVV